MTAVTIAIVALIGGVSITFMVLDAADNWITKALEAYERRTDAMWFDDDGDGDELPEPEVASHLSVVSKRAA